MGHFPALAKQVPGDMISEGGGNGGYTSPAGLTGGVTDHGLDGLAGNQGVHPGSPFMSFPEASNLTSARSFSGELVNAEGQDNIHAPPSGSDRAEEPTSARQLRKRKVVSASRSEKAVEKPGEQSRAKELHHAERMREPEPWGPQDVAWMREIKECPTFHPSEEEFADPLAYIKNIQELAGFDYGICKVVPPLGPRLPGGGVLLGRGQLLAFQTYTQQLRCPEWGRDDPSIFREDDGCLTLPEFQRMADDFMISKFGTTAAPPKEFLEAEFWKEVQSRGALEVKYGSIPGASAFFPASYDPLGSSNWNLKALPRLEKSLLRSLADRIPVVADPKLYVSMLFTVFAWGIEEHALCSIHYHHLGAPRSWYGVPGAAALDFEKVAAEEVLGKRGPPSGAALATLVDRTAVFFPRVLASRGVPVCRTVQNPGEFVITFPRAYHSGFSHGFNMLESVNFAMADWLPYGAACSRRYRLLRRPPSLPFDELLSREALSVAHQEQKQRSRAQHHALLLHHQQQQQQQQQQQHIAQLQHHQQQVLVNLEAQQQQQQHQQQQQQQLLLLPSKQMEDLALALPAPPPLVLPPPSVRVQHGASQHGMTQHGVTQHGVTQHGASGTTIAPSAGQHELQDHLRSRPGEPHPGAGPAPQDVANSSSLPGAAGAAPQDAHTELEVEVSRPGKTAGTDGALGLQDAQSLGCQDVQSLARQDAQSLGLQGAQSLGLQDVQARNGGEVLEPHELASAGLPVSMEPQAPPAPQPPPGLPPLPPPSLPTAPPSGPIANTEQPSQATPLLAVPVSQLGPERGRSAHGLWQGQPPAPLVTPRTLALQDTPRTIANMCKSPQWQLSQTPRLPAGTSPGSASGGVQWVAAQAGLDRGSAWLSKEEAERLQVHRTVKAEYVRLMQLQHSVRWLLHCRGAAAVPIGQRHVCALQCALCSTPGYYAMVLCKCHPKAICLHHPAEIASCPCGPQRQCLYSVNLLDMEAVALMFQRDSVVALEAEEPCPASDALELDGRSEDSSLLSRHPLAQPIPGYLSYSALAADPQLLSPVPNGQPSGLESAQTAPALGAPPRTAPCSSCGGESGKRSSASRGSSPILCVNCSAKAHKKSLRSDTRQARARSDATSQDSPAATAPAHPLGKRKSWCPGHEAVGKRVRVWWDLDHTYYLGWFTGYDTESGKHQITYDDGDKEDVWLPREDWDYVDQMEGVELLETGNVAGQEAVGKRVKIWWPTDQMYHYGAIESFEAAEKKHGVLYDNGGKVAVVLEHERWCFVPERQPTPDPATDAADDAAPTAKPTDHGPPSSGSHKKKKSHKKRQPSPPKSKAGGSSQPKEKTAGLAEDGSVPRTRSVAGMLSEPEKARVDGHEDKTAEGQPEAAEVEEGKQNGGGQTISANVEPGEGPAARTTKTASMDGLGGGEAPARERPPAEPRRSHHKKRPPAEEGPKGASEERSHKAARVGEEEEGLKQDKKPEGVPKLQGEHLARRKQQQCKVEGCSKFSRWPAGMCAAHTTQLATVEKFTCKRQGCGKVVQGSSAFCKSHARELLHCQEGGCMNKADASTPGLCKEHGGVALCFHEGCVLPMEGGFKFCSLHMKDACQVAGCGEAAVEESGLCKGHWQRQADGGKSSSHKAKNKDGPKKPEQEFGMCKAPGCRRKAVDSSTMCAEHRGLKCQAPNCRKVTGGGSKFCKEHSSSRQCLRRGCKGTAVGTTSFCAEHVGTKLCKAKNCKNTASIGAFCRVHAKKCEVEGCLNPASSKSNRCATHGGGK